MGGQQSQESQRFIQHFQEQFTLIRDLNDSRFGEVQIFKNRSAADLIMVKVYWSQNELDYKNALQKCEKRSQVENVHLLKLLGYHANQSNQLCGDFTKISIYFEFYENNIEKVIERKNSRKQFYTEQELWNIFYQIISTCVYLEGIKRQLADIRPCNIMVNNEGQLKLAEYGLVQGDKTGFQKAYYNQEKVYLAPEFLPFISEQLSNPPPVTQKSDVFSLGLTMLECSTLVSAKNLYSFSKNGMQLDYQMMNAMLDQLPQLGYTQTWYRMVREMVRENPEERPCFSDIENVLAPFKSQIEQLQPFSLNEQGRQQQSYPVTSYPTLNPNQSTIFPDQGLNLVQKPPLQASYFAPQPIAPVYNQPPYQQHFAQSQIPQQQLPSQSVLKVVQQPSQLQYYQPTQQYPMQSGQGKVIQYSPQKSTLDEQPLSFQTQPIQDVEPIHDSPNQYQQYNQPQQAPFQLPRPSQYMIQQPNFQQPYEIPPTQQQQYYPQYQPPNQYQQDSNVDPSQNDQGLSDLDLRIQRALKSSQETANRHYQTPSYY